MNVGQGEGADKACLQGEARMWGVEQGAPARRPRALSRARAAATIQGHAEARAQARLPDQGPELGRWGCLCSHMKGRAQRAVLRGAGVCGGCGAGCWVGPPRPAHLSPGQLGASTLDSACTSTRHVLLGKWLLVEVAATPAPPSCTRPRPPARSQEPACADSKTGTGALHSPGRTWPLGVRPCKLSCCHPHSGQQLGGLGTLAPSLTCCVRALRGTLDQRGPRPFPMGPAPASASKMRLWEQGLQASESQEGRTGITLCREGGGPQPSAPLCTHLSSSPGATTSCPGTPVAPKPWFLDLQNWDDFFHTRPQEGPQSHCIPPLPALLEWLRGGGLQGRGPVARCPLGDFGPPLPRKGEWGHGLGGSSEALLPLQDLPGPQGRGPPWGPGLVPALSVLKNPAPLSRRFSATHSPRAPGGLLWITPRRRAPDREGQCLPSWATGVTPAE